MSEPMVIHIDEIEGAHGGVFKPVGRTLGVTAFGVNVEQYPQGHDQYPDHDHAKDGQEEVYYVISGQATLTIDGDDHIMRAGSIAYVPAGPQPPVHHARPRRAVPRHRRHAGHAVQRRDRRPRTDHLTLRTS